MIVDPPMDETHQQLQVLRVMLVEDDPRIVKLLTLMLAAMDVQLVFSAGDGVQALRFLGENEGAVNAVICDWNMPLMSGIELLRQVRSVDPQMHFLMVTGQPTAEHVMEARRYKVSDFIAKPFYAETIGQKLELVARELCARSQLAAPSPVITT
jgi:two-component system, chemotaxis family, chemotaxis protein CheY